MTEYFDYPDHMILESDRAVGYLTAALRAGVSTVRTMMNKKEYLDIMGYDSIPVDMEAPNENQQYPYIHVMYRNKGIQPATLDDLHYVEYKTQEDGKVVAHDDVFSIYKFSGEYILNIYATTILERETIADTVIGALAIDPRFKQLLIDNPYLGISPNLDTFDTLSSNESWGTPWSADVMTAYRQCNFSVVGEFVWRYGTPAEFISAINISAVLGGIG